jgi:hypothetical protein
VTYTSLLDIKATMTWCCDIADYRSITHGYTGPTAAIASPYPINDYMLNTEFSNRKNTKISWFNRELDGKKEIGLPWPTVELEPTLDRVVSSCGHPSSNAAMTVASDFYGTKGTVDEPQTGQPQLDIM